ncbi:MAG: hypothetical protein ACPGLV_02230 [Bacteroidia bacterium]
MLDEIEKEILECLTFEESLAHIYEEIGRPKPVVLDVLKTLLTKDLVQAFAIDLKSGRPMPTPFYDSDKMDEFLFRITKKGIDRLY